MTIHPPPPESWIDTPVAPGPPDLIPGLLPRQGALLLTGETEVGKTLTALEIVHCVVTGAPLWGKVQPTTTVGQVTYILGEHHDDILRSLWLKQGFQVEGRRAVQIIGPQSRRPLVSRGDLMVGNRQAMIEWTAGSGLIVFDPLNAFATGSDVENDSAQMRSLINAMSDVASTHKAALLILAHMGKPSFDQKQGKYKHRETYASRGSSAIEDAVVACYYMEKARGEAGVVFRLTRRKYKGEAPDHYILKRDGLCQTLVAGGIMPSSIRAIRSEGGRFAGSQKTQT